MRADLADIRAALGRLHLAGEGKAPAIFGLGVPAVDQYLGGGLVRGGLHEIYAAQPGDAASAAGFILAVAVRAAAGRPAVWIRHDYANLEAGALHGPGLAELGLDVNQLALVRARNPADALRAGAEAVGCGPLGAVILEIWGPASVLGLTESRRLLFAARHSDVPVLMMRAAALPVASAAMTRWRVSAGPSRPLEAGAPGLPCFALSLLRNRVGPAGESWLVEWNRDQRAFSEIAPVAGGLASLSSGGRIAPAHPGALWRKAG